MTPRTSAQAAPFRGGFLIFAGIFPKVRKTVI